VNSAPSEIVPTSPPVAPRMLDGFSARLFFCLIVFPGSPKGSLDGFRSSLGSHRSASAALWEAGLREGPSSV
jgi:hypothetical protein